MMISQALRRWRATRDDIMVSEYQIFPKIFQLRIQLGSDTRLPVHEWNNSLSDRLFLQLKVLIYLPYHCLISDQFMRMRTSEDVTASRKYGTTLRINFVFVYRLQIKILYTWASSTVFNNNNLQVISTGLSTWQSIEQTTRDVCDNWILDRKIYGTILPVRART